MFRATVCPSSGGITVSMRHLVFVNPCGWLVCRVCIQDCDPRRVTNTKCCIQ